MRANWANSSTRFLSASTSSTIARVHSVTIFSKSGSDLSQALRTRWAESWIGVSGFLISWASLRATSPQAATFCARISGVRSSTTTMAPGAEPSEPGRLTTVTARWRSRSRDGTITSRSWRDTRPESSRSTSAWISSRPGPRMIRSSGSPTAPGSSSSSRCAAAFTAVTVASSSTTTTPVPTVSSTVSVSRRRSSSSWFLRTSPARENSTSSSLRASRSDMRLNEAISARNSSLPVGKSTRTPRCPAAMRSAPSATSRIGVVMRRER